MKHFNSSIIATLFSVFLSVNLFGQVVNCPLTTPDFPIHTKYETNYEYYSWSAGLYMPSQVGGAQTINSISYRLANTNGDAGTFSDIRVYVRHTSVTNYASSPGYPGTTGFTQVYGGAVTYGSSNNITYTFTFSSAFVYNGTQNLEVLIENRGGIGSGYDDAEPWFYRTNDAGAGNFCGKVWAGTTWASAISGSANQRFNLAIFTGQPNTFCGAFPLSITLKNFTSKCEGDQTRLDWGTVSEKNNDYFIIEKSNDGTAWSELAQVKGYGTTNEEQDYSFSDRNTSNVTVYYRLKQVDFDGTEETLNVIASNCLPEGKAAVSPNPTEGAFEVFNINKGDEITVYDMMGNVVNQTTALSNFASVDLSTQQTGVYMISVLSTEGNQMVKVVKR